ncbi:MAG: alternate-type signal peptide domain-containing protein [Arthrobacter sp.]|jgi:alternate signal-mediated exported protein|nr:alternate-type signal peptide domain-containing protein [Arthrobacter sp.]
MKKLTKGALAAAAGVTLLIAGGGTLASWNDSVNVGGDVTLTAGDLHFATPSAPTWTYTPSVGAERTGLTAAQVAALRLVPGDQLTSTGTYQITAQGDGLKFDVGITGGSIAAASPGTAADDALATLLSQTATYEVNGVSGSSGTITHTSATAKDYDVKISVTLTWPFATAPGTDNAGKLGSVDLSQFAVTATQTQ